MRSYAKDRAASCSLQGARCSSAHPTQTVSGGLCTSNSVAEARDLQGASSSSHAWF